MSMPQDLPPEQVRRVRNIAVMTILGILIAVTFIISMNTGFIRLLPMEVMRTLFGMGTEEQSLILFEFRLPRIVISVLAGAGLMVVLFISFYPTREVVPVFMLPVLALIGAGLAAILIYMLSYKKHRGLSPTRLLLTGVAVASGISAAMIVLTLKFDPNQYQFVSTWLAGTIWGSNWKFVLALLPWIIVLSGYVFYKARVLNILNLGEQTPTGLGLSVEKDRRLLLLSAVALAGSSVAVSGGIGFIGLVGPHLAARLVGPRNQALLPTSALVGALLLIISDTLGRSILQPSELPAGIIVAVIGAPYFLYLLAKAK